MGGSYRQCSECGKRALSIATRCPGCGRELEPHVAPETRPVLEVGRYLPLGVVAAVALAAVVLAVSWGVITRYVTAQPAAWASEVATLAFALSLIHI